MDKKTCVSGIAVKELCDNLAAQFPVLLIDVRTPAEYAAAHISQAASRPLETLNTMELARECSEFPGTVYVICQTGGRARKAIVQLEQVGCSECLLVEGGMRSWIAAGFEVKRQARGVISLERQVRIAAGALVFAATVLGAFVHPAFLLISGFVGAGLVFAGISDTCGMGMLLARMPWNQVRGVTSSATCGCARTGP